MCDLDMPDVCQESTQKARTQHRCSDCYGLIVTGEEYIKFRGKWSDDWRTYKWCLRCSELRDFLVFQLDHDAACIALDGLFEEIHESYMSYQNVTPPFSVLRKMAAIRKHNRLTEISRGCKNTS